jgi:hypothetical protein
MKELSLTLIAIASLLFATKPALAADVIDASLLLRFNFDSAPVNGVITDTSPAGAHPGTNFFATWRASENGRNGVMDFIAPIPNCITVPAIPALNSSVGTICFWMKSPGSYLRGNFAAVMFDRRGADGDVITLTDAGTIFVQARSGYANANAFSGSVVINDNTWHHIAYVYDQSLTGSISIYVDGVLDTSQSNIQQWSWPSTQPIRLGCSPDTYWRSFVGLMDDFQIHNRMLTPAEVAATFAGNPVLDSSLVERLNFTAAPVNNVVVDSSPSNNSATNQSATWVSADTGRNGLMRFDLVMSQITAQTDPGLDSTEGTIAFWMKSTGNLGPGDFASIIFDRREFGNGDVISMKDDGTIFVQAQGSYAGVNSFATQASVNDGLWHHVAYVYDQSAQGSIRVYIDGVTSGFQSNSAAWSWSAGQQIELGLSHDTYWFGFNGALDEFRFYNRMLSPTEIGLIGVPPALRFDVQPATQSAFVGDDVTLAAVANMPSTYQWRFGGVNLPGATNTRLVLSNAQPANAGSYTVTASNASFGVVTSTPAILTINPRPSLSASMVARYNFDAAPVNDVIVDSALGSKHPGTNVLATWASAVGGRSGVMQFTATGSGSQIVIPAHPDFNSTKGTIAFWLKTAGNDTNDGDFAAILFDRRTGDGDVLTMVDDGTLFNQAYSHQFNINSFEPTNTVNDNQWHHIAYVYDQGTLGGISFYIDAQLAGSNPNTGAWAWDPAEQIELGKSHDSYWRRLDGYLDDVQFYNRILTPAELNQAMTLGPVLNIARAGNQLTLSWTATGYVLQQNPNLSNPGGWSDVSGGASSPVIVTIPASGSTFYRLHKP